MTGVTLGFGFCGRLLKFDPQPMRFLWLLITPTIVAADVAPFP